MSQSSGQFDVGGQQIASIYAKAFFDAATEDPAEVGSLVEELEAVVAYGVWAHPEFQELLANELIPPTEKVGILDRVFAGRVSQLVLNFLKVVAEHERLAYLSLMSAESRVMLDESLERRRVHVTTAAPMDSGTLQSLTATLREQLGREPSVVTDVDPALIGGLVIRIGDRVYDGSVSDRIRRMRTELSARYSEAIETRRGDLVAEFTES